MVRLNEIDISSYEIEYPIYSEGELLENAFKSNSADSLCKFFNIWQQEITPIHSHYLKVLLNVQ